MVGRDENLERAFFLVFGGVGVFGIVFGNGIGRGGRVGDEEWLRGFGW